MADTMTTTPEAIICSACGGDPRQSAHCEMCGGAGIGIPSAEGFLVWNETVDDFSIALRKIKTKATGLFHFFILVLVLLSLVLFAWQVNALEDASVIRTADFWFVGHWYVTQLWLGLLLACFLIFRLSKIFSRDQSHI